VELDISYTDVSNIMALKNLTELERIYAEDCIVSDIALLREREKLGNSSKILSIMSGAYPYA
jgi:hypothetical protein